MKNHHTIQKRIGIVASVVLLLCASGCLTMNSDLPGALRSDVSSYCTCSILVPQSYMVSGDIVRIRKSALPGTPLALSQESTTVQKRIADNTQVY